jgi:EAL domain-containing protein (putative c-di-GMP-specific phosphodiesterase class I)
MYRAKEAGRDGLRLYTPEMSQSVQDRYNLRAALRGALQRGELALFYQPQVELSTRRMIGAEALIRWRHPDLGLVPPCRFIPLAEETGLIAPIGEWVINEACRRNKAWQNRGLPPIRISVNVSARQFRDGTLTDVVAQALAASGLAAAWLELELTESLLMDDREGGARTMRELRALGVSLAIDDFGTGYSSLSAVKTFPISRLKIDRSFVEGLPDNADDAAVAGAVIALGRQLGLEVIAEGVETEEQAAALAASGCDEAQGYLFSKPVPVEEFEGLLRTRSRG